VKVLSYKFVEVTPVRENCILLWSKTTMRGAVIDPGGEVERILGIVDQVGMRVERILLTHGHFDHVSGAADLRDALGVPVEGPHRADLVSLRRAELRALDFGMVVQPGFVPDRRLEDGDTVAVGEFEFNVVWCPGHSPGSIAFVQHDERVAVVGDVIMRGSIGRTDIAYGDASAMAATLRDRILTLPDDMLLLSGHGPASQLGAERQSNIALRQTLLGARH
jgi:glyoxylase-like metal-dependent hydrolase (beta-lactamase superfamily II)